jgi:hypothetical protein
MDFMPRYMAKNPRYIGGVSNVDIDGNNTL